MGIGGRNGKLPFVAQQPTRPTSVGTEGDLVGAESCREGGGSKAESRKAFFLVH